MMFIVLSSVRVHSSHLNKCGLTAGGRQLVGQAPICPLARHSPIAILTLLTKVFQLYVFTYEYGTKYMIFQSCLYCI